MTVTKKQPWGRLDLTTLPNSRWIACDPSLTATGLVYLEINDGTVTVLDAEKLSTVPVAKGWEDTFIRAELIEKQIVSTLSSWLFDWGRGDIRAIHESPPTGGGTLVRTESTILTGYAFRNAVQVHDLTIDKMATPQAHKKLVCGNGRATKQEHHAELKLLLSDILDGNLITNEAHRDALSIALYGAWRLNND